MSILCFSLTQSCDSERQRARQYAAQMPAVACHLTWQKDDNNQAHYRLRNENQAAKPIKAVVWKYLNANARGELVTIEEVFYEKDFLLPPDQEKKFQGSYQLPESRSEFLRGILNITRIVFADGSEWQRLASQEPAYNRALLEQDLSKMDDGFRGDR